MASNAIIAHVVLACLRVKPQLIGAVAGSVGNVVTAISRDTALIAAMWFATMLSRIAWYFRAISITTRRVMHVLVST